MQPRIVAYLEQHGPIPNLEFVYLPRRRWEKAVNSKPLLNHIAYRGWLRHAFRVAQRLHSQVRFDIAHQITFTGFREPSHLYQLGIPFVWGSVGGAQDYPWRFLAGAGLSGASFEAVRSILSYIELHASPRVRAAAKSAAAIFAANSECQRKLRQVLGVESTLLCDVGTATLSDESLRPRSNSEPIRILWAGRLATWKALELLIEALALLPGTVPYELRVIGDGPRCRRWQRLAQRRGISANIRWCGQVSHDQALELFRWTDLFVFTSLRDTTGTVVLEAIAAGKPVICLDHQGTGDVITHECGIKIPVTNRKAVQRELCSAIARLQGDYELCQHLARGARRRAASYLWSLQARRIVEEYNRILASVGSDARCEIGNAVESEDIQLPPPALDVKSAPVESMIS